MSVANWIREHQHDISVFLFLTAGLTGVFLHGKVLHPEGGWGAEMMHLAYNIAYHGAFANPYSSLNTGLTANNPPLFPFLAAGLYKVFREGASVYFAAVLVSILANAITAALLPRVSVVFFNDCMPGVIAALLWTAAMPALPGWDTSYTIAGLLLFCILSSPFQAQGERNLATRAASAGVVAGLLALLNPSSLLVSAPWMAFVLWRSQMGLRPAVRYVAILLLPFGLITGSWVVRNYVRLGTFAIRTGFGITLYYSNNDCAQSSHFKNTVNGCSAAHLPNMNTRDAQLLLRAGEAQYNRICFADAKNWAEANPSRFLNLTAKRALEFWFPATEVAPTNQAYFLKYDFAPNWVATWVHEQNRTAYTVWIITALSIPGLILMARRGELVTIFVLVVLAVYPLMYYVMVSDMRYRYPILWLSLLPAGYFVGALGDSLARRQLGLLTLNEFCGIVSRWRSAKRNSIASSPACHGNAAM
jgi:hypothetical protein